jgi:hypothetical protein
VATKIALKKRVKVDSAHGTNKKIQAGGTVASKFAEICNEAVCSSNE